MLFRSGLDLEREGVGREVEAARLAGEERPRGTAEVDRDLRNTTRQPLAGTNIERDPLPAPVVDREAQGSVGLGRGTGGDALFLEVTRHRLARDEAGGVLGARGVPARSDGEEQPAIDARWTTTSATTATLVVQRPRVGRFRLDVDARVPGGPATQGTLPCMRTTAAATSAPAVEKTRGLIAELLRYSSSFSGLPSPC